MFIDLHYPKRLTEVTVLSVLLLFSAFVIASAKPAKEKGFKPIFNGENLQGWNGHDDLWSVENGAIVGKKPENAPGYNTFLVWEEAQPEHFELKLEFHIESGNSGIQYRSKRVKNRSDRLHGYQADLNYSGEYVGANYDEGGRGMLAQRGQKVAITEKGKKKKVGQIGDRKELLKSVDLDGWNEYHIIARGNHLVHKINGQVMSVVEDREQAKERGGGYIGFQLHQGREMTVKFRNIRLKMRSAPGQK